MVTFVLWFFLGVGISSRYDGQERELRIPQREYMDIFRRILRQLY
jgi:hypothetical protein